MAALATLACLGTPQQRLLVAYVAGQQRPQRHLQEGWSRMQVEYPRWTLSCLLVAGVADQSTTEYAHEDHGAGRCSALSVRVPSEPSELRLGHAVQGLLAWLGSGLPAAPGFDYLLKAEPSTLICFSMITDLLEPARVSTCPTAASAPSRIRR